MNPNLVPTGRTLRLADTLIREARDDTATDAVLNHLDHIDLTQVHALLAVVLGHIPRPSGRPRIAVELSAADRRQAHAAYGRGDRTPEVLAGEREYQRVYKREKRKKAS